MEYGNPRLDKEGMPKLFFKSKDSNRIYTSINDILSNQIYNILSKSVPFLEAKNIVSNFINNLNNFTKNKDGETLSKLFNSILILSKFNVFNNLKNIECGFLSKNVNNIFEINNNDDFISVINNYQFNINKFLDLFNNYSLSNIQEQINNIIINLDNTNITYNSDTSKLYEKLTFESFNTAKDLNLQKIYNIIINNDPNFAEELKTN